MALVKKECFFSGAILHFCLLGSNNNYRNVQVRRGGGTVRLSHNDPPVASRFHYSQPKRSLILRKTCSGKTVDSAAEAVYRAARLSTKILTRQSDCNLHCGEIREKQTG